MKTILKWILIVLFFPLSLLFVAYFNQKRTMKRSDNKMDELAKEPMTPLQENTQSKLYRFLECLSSIEEQKRYKNAVPFVHIPYELMAQWDGNFIKDQQWFRDIWNDEEWIVLWQFDKEINLLWNELPEESPDVPDIFENETWLKAVALAKKTIKGLRR